MGLVPEHCLSYHEIMLDVAELEGYLGHTFRERALLVTALRHKSYVHEYPIESPNNERLEFLGDAVLSLAITHLLMEKEPALSEGELSHWRSHLISTASLAQQARNIDLGQHLLLGKGEEQAGGRNKPTLLADAFEALLGALYKELGFERTLLLIRRLYTPALEQPLPARDPKSAFQAAIQAQFRTSPRYVLLQEEGPAHKREFVVGVYLHNKEIAQGKGASKQEAEQQAALQGLHWLSPQESQ